MALTGVQIFKLLPKTNCKKCGFPTCLAFAMKLAQGGVDLSACPDVSEEAKKTLGETIQSLQESKEGVEVTFSSGRVATFDVVVGADGLNSKLRSDYFPNPPKKVYAGYTCWRFICDNPSGQSHMMEMWGKGKRMGVVPLTQNRVYVFLVANAPEGADSPKDLAAFFQEFGGPAKEILAQIQKSDVLHHDLADLEFPMWSQGRLCLLGDAAHGMTPNMGQGAAQSIESAWTLAQMLMVESDFEQAFQRYQKIRSSRVQQVMTRSRRLGAISQWENGLARWLRDWGMRLTPQSAIDGGMHDLFGEGEKLLTS